MKEKIEVLVKLQRIESEAVRVKSLLDGLPARLKRLDAEIAVFENDLERESSRLAELKKKYRVHEADAQMTLSKERKTQEKLTMVKNNKEYQSILKEIEDLKEIRSRIEDEMIECLEEMDRTAKVCDARKREFEALVAGVASERDAMQKEAESRRVELERLETERKDVARISDPAFLAIYEKKKGQVHGAVIVPVRDSVCQGCNLNIPAQLYNELHRYDSLRHCPHCKRLIFWEGNGSTAGAG
jgi:uncharacterized protein